MFARLPQVSNTFHRTFHLKNNIKRNERGENNNETWLSPQCKFMLQIPGNRTGDFSALTFFFTLSRAGGNKQWSHVESKRIEQEIGSWSIHDSGKKERFLPDTSATLRTWIFIKYIYQGFSVKPCWVIGEKRSRK